MQSTISIHYITIITGVGCNTQKPDPSWMSWLPHTCTYKHCASVFCNYSHICWKAPLEKCRNPYCFLMSFHAALRSQKRGFVMRKRRVTAAVNFVHCERLTARVSRVVFVFPRSPMLPLLADGGRRGGARTLCKMKKKKVKQKICKASKKPCSSR